MNTKAKILLMAGLLGCAANSLSAASFTLGGETDTLSITLDPTDGAIHGAAGSIPGWGFTVEWTAINNYISFTGSSLGSETNSSFLTSYTDYIGANGGPDGFALGDGVWTQTFDSILSTGVGSYAISSDPEFAVIAALDSGLITFNFDIYSGNPNPDPGAVTYLGSFSDTAAFSTSVDGPADSTTPEPGSAWLLVAGAVVIGLARYGRRACQE